MAIGLVSGFLYGGFVRVMSDYLGLGKSFECGRLSLHESEVGALGDL